MNNEDLQLALPTEYKDMYDHIYQYSTTEKDLPATLSFSIGIFATYLSDLNWIGFYIKNGRDLIPSYYQGRPIFSRTDISDTIYGSAVQEKKTVIVNDIETIRPIHESNGVSGSAIAIPILFDNNVYSVLYMTSPTKNNFDKNYALGMERIALLLEKTIDAKFSAYKLRSTKKL